MPTRMTIGFEMISPYVCRVSSPDGDAELRSLTIVQVCRGLFAYLARSATLTRGGITRSVSASCPCLKVDDHAPFETVLFKARMNPQPS